LDSRRRDGGTNSTLRTKEQGKHITLNEHDDDDDEKELSNDVWYTVHGLLCTTSSKLKFIPNEFGSVEHMLPSWSWQEIKSNNF